MLPAPSVSALHKKRSVQERLTPKAGNLSHQAGGGGGGFPPRARPTTAGHSTPASWRSVEAVEAPALNNNNYRYQYQPPQQPPQPPLPQLPPSQPKLRTAPGAPGGGPPSADPVLDRIVAKLKAGLALSESPSRQAVLGGGGGCLCERPTQLVLCQRCGETYPGRIALSCPSHPRKLFLQDLQRCRRCLAGNLDDMKEFELPPGMKETLGKVKKYEKF